MNKAKVKQTQQPSPLAEVADPAAVVFTRKGFWRGVRATTAIALCVATYGALYGLIARQEGLPFDEAIVMSAVVFAGASQLVVVKMWGDPLPIFLLTVTVFVVNLRYMLMGAVLHPWMRGLTGFQKYCSMFLMVDESWALAMKEFKSGYNDFAFLAGSGFIIYWSWLGSSIAGYQMAGMIKNPAEWGMDFAFVSVFIALCAGLYRIKLDLLPWVVAAAVAVGTTYIVDGTLYIITGAIAGSIVGAYRHG